MSITWGHPKTWSWSPIKRWALRYQGLQLRVAKEQTRRRKDPIQLRRRKKGSDE